MSAVRIASPVLTAEVGARGAELVALATGQGRPLLWYGDPAWWSGRSPLLFPIVGKVRDDRLLVNGRGYEMPQHGFARRMDFTLLQADPASCVFELRANPETLRCYPFSFCPARRLSRFRPHADGGRHGLQRGRGGHADVVRLSPGLSMAAVR
jgi:galactose mutarotase-like enzyme